MVVGLLVSITCQARSSRLSNTSNCKINGHSSKKHHHFSAGILHSFCIFNRKFRKMLAFILQFAYCWVLHCDVMRSLRNTPKNEATVGIACGLAQARGAAVLEICEQPVGLLLDLQAGVPAGECVSQELEDIVVRAVPTAAALGQVLRVMLLLRRLGVGLLGLLLLGFLLLLSAVDVRRQLRCGRGQGGRGSAPARAKPAQGKAWLRRGMWWQQEQDRVRRTSRRNTTTHSARCSRISGPKSRRWPPSRASGGPVYH